LLLGRVEIAKADFEARISRNNMVKRKYVKVCALFHKTLPTPR